MGNKHGSIKTGFTLVEVLLISPIVILFIGAFIGFIVNLTGESLVQRTKNVTTYNVQAALNDIEANIEQSIAFQAATSGVSSPQGKDDSATQFSNTTTGKPDTLILKTAATTKNPSDPNRTLIYVGAGACDNKNPIYAYTTVYFVNPTDNALYKRTILPAVGACAKPWQRGSCNDAVVNANPSICKASDEKILDGVTGMTVQYYSTAGAPTSLAATDAGSATTASVTLNVSKPTAGSTIAYSNSVRVTSLNAQPNADTTPPTNPDITWSRAAATPYKTDFSWVPVGNATGYKIRYRIGNATWVNGPQNLAAASYSVTATARKQNVDIEVTTLTDSGSSPYGTMLTTIPKWNDVASFQNGWQNYSSSYNDAGFTKTTSGAVGLKGLVKLGTVGTTVFTLPVGFRPQNRLMFQAVANDPASANWGARVDVLTDGSVNVVTTQQSNNAWVSLDGIIFLTSDANPSWQNGPWNSPWSYNNYGTDYSDLKYYRDTSSRVWIQGLGSGGAQNSTIAWIPGSNVYFPDANMHTPSYSGNGPGAVNVGTGILSRSSGSFISTQYLYYAAGAPMQAANLYNGWVNYTSRYGQGWTNAKCLKGNDDIVIFQGLVTGGSTNTANGMTSWYACSGTYAGMSTGRTAILPVWYEGEKAGRVDMSGDYFYPINVSAGFTSLDGLHYIAD